MKKRRKEGNESSLRLQFVILVLSGIITLGILLFLFLFRVTSVTVEGNIHYTDEEIKSLVLDGFMADNSLVLSIFKREVIFQDIPFLNSANVQMTGRDSVRIRVHEKSIVGYVEYADGYWYFDREGIVVERCVTPAMTAEERIAKEESEKLRSEAEASGMVAVMAELTTKNYVPEVRGFTFQEVVLGEQLPVENDSIFNTLYSLNQMMNKDNIPADFVLFDGEYNIFLYYGDVEICLGQDDHLEDKMTTLASIMPQMEGLPGTLHLENYSEVDTGVVFEKSE